MPGRRTCLLLACLVGGTQIAQAQLLMQYFPEGVPGYGSEPGVTVLSRARPAFDPLGVRLGSTVARPLLSESLGYDDNIFAGSHRIGAWQIATRPSILLGTDNSHGGMGVYASADDVRYLGQPSQNRTDGAAFAGGTINLGRDRLTVGAGYLARHEDRNELDALPSDRPIGFSVINLRASYDALFGRFSLTPAAEFNRWRFDNTSILGQPVSQSDRDRSTGQFGMTLRYDWMSGRDLLVVGQVLDTHYDHPASGVASNNSTNWRLLVGADYDDDTVWRYRLLGGVEYRQAQIGSFATGIVEAEIVWSPSGMTTVHASATRGIADAAQTGLVSYTYTSARVSVDHEVWRDLLLNASLTAREATFHPSGGQQIGFDAGVGATWLMNRHARLSPTYDFSDVRNAHLPAGTVTGDYTRSVTLLTLRLGM